MRIKIFIAAIMLGGLTFAPLAAQNGAAPKRTLELTLDEAIGIALSENPTIKVADLEIERQDYVRKETLGNLYPNLSGTGNYTRSIVKQTMSREGLSFGADNSVTATASLTVPLFAPAVYANLKLNRTQMEAAVEAARSSKITLVNEVKKAYYGILLAEQSLEVLAESEAMMKKTVDNTQVMFDNELSSEYDLLTAQVQLSNLQPTIIQTKNALEISKMMFRMLLSLPQDVEFTLTGDLDSHMADILAGGIQYTTDVADNSDLRTLDLQDQMLQQQIKLINSQRLPVIAAFGQATIAGNDMEDIGFGDMLGGGDLGSIDPTRYPTLMPLFPDLMKLYSDLFGGSSPSTPATGFWWQHPVSVGVQISIPIFSGNKYNNQARQAKNSLNQLRLQRDYVEESIKLQAQSSINNIFAAREKMYANEKTMEQARKAYEISLSRYDAGMGTILELNSAELSYTQAKLNHSQSIYDYLSAQADYEKTVGREYEYTGR